MAVFFRKVAKVVDIPWQIAGCEDFRYPETQGRKPPMTDLLNGYLARVHRATHHDSVVYLQFLRVMNLMASPSVSCILGLCVVSYSKQDGKPRR
ncbi:MAG: hypothetical protein R3B95_04060 [Nitrospirales bacterium]|nr:hypothetical protein [Nitrospirales bacterium]